MIHVATIGGKVGNYKAVKTKAKKNKVEIEDGKSFKLAGKGVPQSKKLKVKAHTRVRYESANNDIAKVTAKGYTCIHRRKPLVENFPQKCPEVVR
jgi:hypothetical protein